MIPNECRTCGAAADLHEVETVISVDNESVKIEAINILYCPKHGMCANHDTIPATLDAFDGMECENCVESRIDSYEDEDDGEYDECDGIGDPGNYDGGFGPDSYFVHAMGKD